VLISLLPLSSLGVFYSLYYLIFEEFCFVHIVRPFDSECHINIDLWDGGFHGGYFSHQLTSLRKGYEGFKEWTERAGEGNDA